MEYKLSLDSIKLKEIFKIVYNFRKLFDIYDAQIANLQKINIKPKTNLSAFNYLDIRELETKKQVLEGIINAFVEKEKYIIETQKLKYNIADVIPSETDYKLQLDKKEITKNVKAIIIDFMKEYSDDYYAQFTQKDLAKIFNSLLSEKMVSTILVKAGFKTKEKLTEEEIKTLMDEYRKGTPIVIIAKMLTRSYSTISNFISKMKKNEIDRNNKIPIYLKHHSIIEILAFRALKVYDEMILYSEHIKRFKNNLSPYTQYFHKYVDLVGVCNGNIVFHIEVENHDVEKSLQKLAYYFKEASLKILFVNKKKYEEAILLRSGNIDYSNILIYKYYQGFEDDFSNDIKQIVKKRLYNMEEHKIIG